MNQKLKKIINTKTIIIVVVIIAAIFGLKTLKTAKSNKIDYRTYTVGKADIRSVVSATGTLEATETVDVGTQISGKITELYVDYNSEVKQGQLIARMDSATYKQEVLSAQAQLSSAEADLLSAQADLIKAEKDYARTEELAKRDLIAKSEVDADLNALNTSRASVAAAKAKVLQYQAALSKAEINLGYTDIFAPVNGIVVSKSVEVGQTVAASYSTPSIVEIARDLTKMQVEIDVDEADIGSVKNGQTAEFTVDSYPDKTYRGTVTQIRLSPTTEDNVVTYTVVAEVGNDDLSLLPGMSANVSLILQECKDALVVPNSALRFKPAEKTEIQGPGGPGGSHKPNVAAVTAPAVYVLEGKSGPVKHEVEKGVTDGESTQIISGINEGDTVIIGVNLQKDTK